MYVFTDPNATPGDEFGAAIAEVGTDLIVGAPGSFGGAGAAYLYDGNPESPTFGHLLATFTDPSPAAASSSAPRWARPTRRS